MKIMKNIFALMLTLTLVFGTMTLPSHAAYTASNVPAYLFDAAYYSAKYSDLAKAFGTDKTKLYNHWITYGIKEGRSPSPVYDPSYYLDNNSDLKKAFGTDYAKLYEHWQNYGINEFRKSSAIYDGNYYKTHYTDLQKAFGTNSLSYLKHFFSNGMSEGRQASSSFNVTDYKSRYSDLQKAFGNNLTSYYYHYMEYGISEGRNGSPSGKYSPSEVGDTTSTASAASLLYPLRGSITTSSSTKTNGFYCDYKTGGSVAVYAPADGTVVFKQAYRNSGGTKKLSSYGNFIEFTSSDGVYKVKMCHLNSFNGVGLSVTQSLSYPCSGSDGVLTLKTKTVKQGDLLGYSGYTGNASGHHLHLEVYKNGKAVDPKSVFTTW